MLDINVHKLSQPDGNIINLRTSKGLVTLFFGDGNLVGVNDSFVKNPINNSGQALVERYEPNIDKRVSRNKLDIVAETKLKNIL